MSYFALPTPVYYENTTATLTTLLLTEMACSTPSIGTQQYIETDTLYSAS